MATKEKSKIKILISGGGTGGHIFPAISIANEIKRRHPNADILFVGAENRMEMTRVPEAGYEIIGLPVAGFDRKRLWRNASVLLKLYKSIHKARSIIRDFKPDIAVGVGGYASGPILRCAQGKGIPTLLQEQNSYAGVTNKMLSRKANVICVAYEDMGRFFPADKIIVTGNPVRSNILDCELSPQQARKHLGLDENRPTILILGGSLGSKTINEAVTAALPRFAEAGISVLWQTGRHYADTCKEAAAPYANVRATPFIDDMAAAYRAADLIVSRAGASTISELQLLGKPAILIPSPNVAEDHQTKNAMALVRRHAAVILTDNEAVERLGETATTLIADLERLKKMRDNVLQMALPDAAAKIVDEIDSIINVNTH